MKNSLIVCAILLFAACAPMKKSTIYWVNSYRVDCVGVGPQKCLLVQNNETLSDTAWQNFYARIDGFEPEPGYLYKISVNEEKLDAANVPADASSIRYTLVKVLEKTPDLKLRLNDIWVLTSLNGKTVRPAKEGERTKDVQMEFHLAEKKVMGTDGCNNFTGLIITVGEKALQLGPLASTRKLCIDITLADDFNQALNKVQSYAIKDLHLILYDKDGTELMTLKKID